MKKSQPLFIAVLFLASLLSPILAAQVGFADSSIVSEPFTGNTMSNSSWISGGNACLTAAGSGNTNPVPSCSASALDSNGSGALRLTANVNNQAGFAIYNTPVSTSQGLEVDFDTYQYGGTGADGIAFFLINGSASPTQPGDYGGALGYSTAGVNPGLVGGYVGVGFDEYGNFSNSAFGSGGIGRVPNSITVRGSAGTNYQYVTSKVASASLANDGASLRTNAVRHMRVSVSTNNVMTVYVDYGSGYVKELSNINLNTINGSGSLPTSFKFGFAASTGGENNYHEINNLIVKTLTPNVSVTPTHSNGFKQGETGTITLVASNDPGAESTTDTITVVDTLPTGLTPTSASGSGWACSTNAQQVTCSRSGSGGNTLAPGQSAPNITIQTVASNTAPVSLVNSATVSTAGNSNPNPTSTDTIAVSASGDADGIPDSIENAAPNNGDANNDGIPDSQQANVTSFIDPVSTKYVSLDAEGCIGGNSNVSTIGAGSLAAKDDRYNYPAGLINFTLSCAHPGDTATVTQYYYGINPSGMVLRKYNPSTQEYTTITGATISSVTIGGEQATKVTYTITDGGPLDADGTANGIIVDPAGLASVATLSDTGINLSAISFASIMIMVAAVITRYRRSVL